MHKRAWSLLWAARYVARWEGWSAVPYQDVVGVWTQGYGHTKDITASSPEITKAQGLRWLTADLRDAARAVKQSVHVKLAVRQRMALISIVFNCGPGAVSGSHLQDDLNAGNYKSAADRFLEWDHAGGVVVEGLRRRRESERQMFLHPKKRHRRKHR